MLWTYHSERIAHLREHDPRGMRRYLISVGDERALIEWDRMQMTSASK